MKLLLLRHGDYIREISRPEQPLSEEGKKELLEVSRWLKSKGTSFDKVFFSTKLRARQSAQLVVQEVNPIAQMEEKPYLAPNDSIEDIWKDIQNIREDVLIVGHLPFLGKLSSRLMKDGPGTKVVRFDTGTLAVLSREEGNAWRLEHVFKPSSI